ncbi:MAG: gamma-glutamyl-phosphate reductase, partial [Pseudomonadota bacterium]|nr:gamma-glutamyl-phosphate reductase [Pseudomonadota bacterium]
MNPAIEQLAANARAASRALARLDTRQRNQALLAIADALGADIDAILEANRRDLQLAEDAVRGAAMVDRLRLTPDRVAAIAASVRQIAELPDPLGAVQWQPARADGLEIG